ncbi:YbcC family protein [Saccharospirillum impatiens]|uniref:YbcC family protein n=1 Tax=Saccharospirillum impatiens TaxID=169438 RepID=UPI0003F62043|nr:DUF2309 domain-containing protein [Saccharospirillum impatiens]
MSLSATAQLIDDQALDSAINAAIDRIAPTWPLDRMIAVNPYWGYVDQPFTETAKHLAHSAGSPMTLSPAWYKNAWALGEITPDALEQARQEMSSGLSTEQVISALTDTELFLPPAPLLADSLDAQRDLQHEPAWCDTITHQIAQFCAAYFDTDQADWRPDQTRPLYASWRTVLKHDHSVALLMKAADLPAKAARLAEDPYQQIRQTLAQLDMPASEIPAYLQAVLMRIGGWAAWCAYRRWQARLDGKDETSLVDLLAIRLSWECLLDDGLRHNASVWSQWQTDWFSYALNREDSAQQPLLIWQRAQEMSYQQRLISQLTGLRNTPDLPLPSVQAAFCIDVRSEVFRRHLEAQSSRIQTLGFAGFFGLPIRYQPLGTEAARPQLPGLLSPTLTVTDTSGDAAHDTVITRQRHSRLQSAKRFGTFQSLPLSAFVLVESLGLGYLTKLVKRTLPGNSALVSDNTTGLNAKAADALQPVLDARATGGVAHQATLAHQILTAMGLTGHLARLVLLTGHGSQTRNNPHRAGLDCGACCGQRGDVNARTLANLLNDPEVRGRVRDKGIDIPKTTWFLAGLHNTTTDEIALFGVDALPASHTEDLIALQTWLRQAQAHASRERAPALGLQAVKDNPKALHKALRAKADDWAETRPEWGLANNAALIVAPRSRTRGLNLNGRCFLHDYDHQKDTEGTLLEQIMTAPMVVANWINLQYYASTVDNHRYGSGNKTLHNVVGGRLGVFEGNGGDLRIGLPLQSVHNGEQWQHTPLRLTVVIEASRRAIDAVIEHHEIVHQLIGNQWLHLVRLDQNQAERYVEGQWQPWSSH